MEKLWAFVRREAVLSVSAVCAVVTAFLVPRTGNIWAMWTCGCCACCCA